MSALRDELLTILDRIADNCAKRAIVLDQMTEILNRKHPVVWPDMRPDSEAGYTPGDDLEDAA